MNYIARTSVLHTFKYLVPILYKYLFEFGAIIRMTYKRTHLVKKGLVVKILGRTNRTHSKLVRDFSKKLPTGIFGCPKLYFGQKN